MPEDSSILKAQPSNGFTPDSSEMGITLEELEQLIREWVDKILVNIDPPSDLWKRIKRQVKSQEPSENSFGP
jgi:hypothetical protein